MADIKSKYYLAHNAGSRTIAGEKFEVTEIKGGTAIGVFEATTLAQQTELDKVVANKASAVESVSKEEYEEYRKKKALNLNDWRHSNLPSTMPQTALKETVGVVVEGAQSVDLTESQLLETEEGARNNLVKLSPPEEQPVGKKKK